MKRATLALALGNGILAMAVLATAMASAAQQAPLSNIEVHPDHSILRIAPAPGERAGESPALQRLVPLPPGTSRAQVITLSGDETGATVRLLPGTLRGLKIAAVQWDMPPGRETRLELRHDGDWSGGDLRLRRYSRDFDALLGGVPAPAALGSGGDRASGPVENGTYVIVTIPDYADAVAPLADWKRRKGLAVEVVTTDETGGSKEAIRDWLRQAYDTWERPPEYLLIVGDTSDVGHWVFSSDATDHPYTLMDEDDWLPDLIMGRLSVSGSYQVQTAVNKTIAYERAPYFGGNPEWFKRFLLVAGNYGSETPTTTTSFCGEQLESVGFENGYDPQPPYDFFNYLDGVYFPPIYSQAQSVPMITEAIDSGVSLVIYRGWAAGIIGWEPPHFTNNEIPLLSSGAMTPIVMSFVCQNAAFASDEDCFGEAWIRQGAPDQRAGAVAFIGNSEHWSHTRYNDAMAMSFFERIIDPGIQTLGQLSVAGRLRFMDYFPHELNVADNGEESVEFYMHIYTLLGDPELNFWRGVPTALTVTHAASLPAGSNFVDVTVSDTGSGFRLPGARVGVVQGDELLGCAWTDADGEAHVSFDRPAIGAALALTVTHAEGIPYEGAISLDAGAAFVTTQSFTINELEGNGDGRVGPGESLTLRATLANGGGAGASGITASIPDTPPYVHVIQGTSSVPDLPAGGSAQADQLFEIEIPDETPDGTLVPLPLSAAHDGGQVDVSDLLIEVFGPDLSPLSVAIGGDGWADPGETVELTVTLENVGRAFPGGGINARLIFDEPSQGVMVDSTCALPDIGPGATGDNAAEPFRVTLDEDLVPGSTVSFELLLASAGGAFQRSGVGILAGRMSPALPVGPDAYGYYAYDSADLFWAQWPAYQWQELSPLFGGTGTKIEYLYDNAPATPLEMPFDFPFYGQVADSIRVSDNGWIAFDLDEVLDFYNWGIPNAHGSHSMIAPFWDNLDPIVAVIDTIPGNEFKDGVYYRHDPVAGTFTVEWSRMRHYLRPLPDFQTFELVLFDPALHPTESGDGRILFQYRQINDGDYLRGYATVGIEDPTETDGLQLSYSYELAPGMAPLTPGLAVSLTTEAPIYAPLRLDSFTGAAASDGCRLAWTSSDPRPVLGWRLYRLEDGRRIPLIDLPAGARSYQDAQADPTQAHEYALRALHPYGQESVLGPFPVLAAGASTLRLALSQSQPNPMKDHSRIDYVMPEAGPLSLKIFDPQGRLVRRLVDRVEAAGEGGAAWDGRNDAGQPVSAGVYFYRLEARGEVLTRKLMLIR